MHKTPQLLDTTTNVALSKLCCGLWVWALRLFYASRARTARHADNPTEGQAPTSAKTHKETVSHTAESGVASPDESGRATSLSTAGRSGIPLATALSMVIAIEKVTSRTFPKLPFSPHFDLPPCTIVH
jgi:hypothetical protein